jgi:LPS export ABC transporter protein LptC
MVHPKKTRLIGSACERTFRGIFLVAYFLLVLSSCRNSIEEINALTYKDTLPMQSAMDVEMIYSDSGEIKAMLRSPQVDHYAGENPYVVMPKGINVIFFDSVKQVKTSLKAGYAIKYEKSEQMEARYKVRIVNRAGEKLMTEHLIWDQSRHIIYTDVPVQIRRNNEVLQGNGMEADESFDKWVIKKPTGTFYINVDEEESDEDGETVN